MNQRAFQAGLLLASTIGAGAAHAFTEASFANTCFFGGSTYMCSESFTSANVLDALVFTGGPVKVHAFFTGPDYFVERDLSSDIFWLFPSTWTVKARLNPWRCAYSGGHSAEGVHAAHGRREGLPLPTYGPHRTADFYVRHYCDCESQIP